MKRTTKITIAVLLFFFLQTFVTVCSIKLSAEAKRLPNSTIEFGICTDKSRRYIEFEGYRFETIKEHKSIPEYGFFAGSVLLSTVLPVLYPVFIAPGLLPHFSEKVKNDRERNVIIIHYGVVMAFVLDTSTDNLYYAALLKALTDMSCPKNTIELLAARTLYGKILDYWKASQPQYKILGYYKNGEFYAMGSSLVGNRR